MVDHVSSRSKGNTINVIDTITVFKYRESVIISNPTEGELTTAASVLVDDDNDLVLPRKKRTESRLEIEHSSYTDVESVGLQVWNGAILLAEFIIFENNKFKNKRVLELGSGTGLVSIIAAKYSARVICTDLNDDKILKTIEQNFEKNRESVRRAEFQVLPFDFSKEWSAEIEAAINETDIIIASELIYDNEISKHLVEVLVKILKKRPTTAIYLSVEKRYVFTLMNQKVEATHYEYFFDLLKKSLSIASSSSLSSPYKLSQIVDIPQYFYEYERCKETELWNLSAMEYLPNIICSNIR